MAEPLGSELPDEVYNGLKVEEATRKSSVITLLTSDKSGYARVCLLSPYQVVAQDKKNLYLAVYTETGTSKNLKRTGKTSLVLVIPPSMYYVNGPVKLLQSGTPKDNSLYHFKVDEVFRDHSSEAPINSDLTFDSTNIESYYKQVFSEIAAALGEAKRGDKK